MPIPELARLSGHVLLDAVVAYDRDAEDDANNRALDLALERLIDLESLRIVHEDDGVEYVDATAVLGPAVVLLLQAVKFAAEAGRESGIPDTAVIDYLRSILDNY